MDYSILQDLLRVSGRVSDLQNYPDMEMIVLLSIAAMMIVVAAMLVSVRPHLLPPGPRLLPLIGNLHLLYRNDFRTLAQKWQKVYGDIYSIYLGRRLVVVVNGKRLLREAFVKNAEIVSDRPSDLPRVKDKNLKGLLYNNGSVWRHQRRFVSNVFRGLELNSDALESKVAPEMICLASSLIELQQRPFNPSKYFRCATSNVLFSVLLGTRFEADDLDFSNFYESLQNGMDCLDINSLIQSQTVLTWIPGYSHRRNKAMAKTQTELRAYIRQHVMNRLEVMDEEEDGSCLADTYLRKIQQDALQGVNTSFDGENLIQLVLELLLTGIEPTAATLEWMVLYLAMNQECQERAYTEIDLVLDGAFPSLGDRPRLPYLEAVISESHRLADVTPFSMMYATRSDSIMDGLQIPRHTLMVPNMTSVLYDPKLFPEPEEFRPDRFLGDCGMQSNKIGFIPFFMGKRACPGEKLASSELFLFITALLQHFRFALPDGVPPPSLDGVLGATRRPSPFQVIAYQRQMQS